MPAQQVCDYILLFFMTSCFGWMMEVTCKLIQYHRFINRGFLIGPYCPIYGCGSLLICLALTRYKADPLAVFGLALLLCGTLEYLTSYLMEKLFHARWWDYSGKRFNLNGRVCANTLIPFGLLGLFIIYVLEPAAFSWFGLLSDQMKQYLSGGLSALFLADTAVSATVLAHIRKQTGNIHGDSTEAITAAVRARLAQDGILFRRAVHAFPNMHLYNRELIEKLQNDRERIRQEARQREQQAREAFQEHMRALKEKTGRD